MASVGTDRWVTRLIAAVRAEGVLLGIVHHEGPSGRLAVIIDGDAERSFITHRGVADALRPTDLKPGWFSGAACLHVLEHDRVAPVGPHLLRIEQLEQHDVVAVIGERLHGLAHRDGIAVQVRDHRHEAATDSSGFYPIAVLPDRVAAEQLAFVRQGYCPLLQHFLMSAPALACLDETLAEARRAGLPLALVLMPEGPAFRSWYAPGGWDQLREAISSLARS